MTEFDDKAAWYLRGAMEFTDDSDVWRPVLDVFVPGTPVTQGSKRARPVMRGPRSNRQWTGKVNVVEELGESLKVWRRKVTRRVRDVKTRTVTGAVRVHLDFVLPRPKNLPGPHTPNAVTPRKNDLDKLQRAVFDAITAAGAWTDDSQVVDVHATKYFGSPDEAPGCVIRIDEAVNP